MLTEDQEDRGGGKTLDTPRSKGQGTGYQCKKAQKWQRIWALLLEWNTASASQSSAGQKKKGSGDDRM